MDTISWLKDQLKDSSLSTNENKCLAIHTGQGSWGQASKEL